MQNPEHLRPADPDQPVVLLAEDDVMVLNIARITLERDGCFLLTAENGEEALYLSRRFPGEIHLLLTDVTMPKIGGMELSKQGFCWATHHPHSTDVRGYLQCGP